jgi:hypothetical protein
VTFESEEVQGAYHELPAQTQLEYCELEVSFARQGKQLHILSVEKKSDEAEITLRIIDKLKFSRFCSN